MLAPAPRSQRCSRRHPVPAPRRQLVRRTRPADRAARTAHARLGPPCRTRSRTLDVCRHPPASGATAQLYGEDPTPGRAQNPADRGAQRGPGHRARGRAAGPAARHTRPTRARDTCHGALTPAAPGTPRMALRHVGRRRVRGATCAFRCHGAPRGPRRATRGQAETTGPLPTSCSCSTRRQQQARHTAPALRAPACA